MKARLIFHALAILGLTAMVVFAQEPTRKPGKNLQPQASAQDDGSAADRFRAGDTGFQSAGRVDQRLGPRQSADGQAASPKVTPHKASDTAKNSAHAMETLSAEDSVSSGNATGGEAGKNENPDRSNPQSESGMKSKDVTVKKDGTGTPSARPVDDNDPKRHPPGSGVAYR